MGHPQLHLDGFCHLRQVYNPEFTRAESTKNIRVFSSLKKPFFIFCFERARLQPCRMLLRIHPALAAEVPFFCLKTFFLQLVKPGYSKHFRHKFASRTSCALTQVFSQTTT